MKPNQTIMIISPGITPYAVHFFSRVAEEVTEYRIRTLFSYQYSMGHWDIPLPPEINPEILGKGEDVLGQHTALRKGWKRGMEVIREIQRTDPSAVMIFGYGCVAHLIVILWCYRNKIPCLMWADSNIKGDRHKGIKAWLKKVILSPVLTACPAILVCGTAGIQYYLKYGSTRDKIFLVPNEPDYFQIEHASPVIMSALAEEFHLDPGRRRFLFSGRIVPVKRVDLLIEAFIRIADQYPNWDLMIAGDGPLKTMLQQRVPARYASRIFWSGFIGTPQRMYAIYRLADVLVIPSDYEPWALVVNEAMCAGMAMISSDVVGAAAELVKDGINGRVFKAGNVHSLTEAMVDVCNESNLTNYRNQSVDILNEWRKTTDPVDGFQKALNYCFNGNHFAVQE